MLIVPAFLYRDCDPEMKKMNTFFSFWALFSEILFSYIKKTKVFLLVAQLFYKDKISEFYADLRVGETFIKNARKKCRKTVLPEKTLSLQKTVFCVYLFCDLFLKYFFRSLIRKVLSILKETGT
jgi:hypothetical protein